jgi:8-oxo-dGTP diphosphatase
MALPPERRFAGVLAHHAGDVVLVRERYEGWGGPFWNVPSGMVESHETPAEGAARELAEETGLVVLPGDLRLRTTTSVVIDRDQLDSWNFEVDVDDPVLRTQDPDRLVQEARWFPVAEAVARLRLLPYRPLADPAIATLTARLAGVTHWTFTSPEADPHVSSSG